MKTVEDWPAPGEIREAIRETEVLLEGGARLVISRPVKEVLELLAKAVDPYRSSRMACVQLDDRQWVVREKVVAIRETLT